MSKWKNYQIIVDETNQFMIMKKEASMNSLQTEQEIFEKGFDSILDNVHGEGGKKEVLVICGDKAHAVLYESKFSKVKNATVILKKRDEVLEWTVEDWHVKKCPIQLAIWIKGSKTLAGLMEDADNKQNYFIIDNKSAEKPQELIVFCAVEIDNKATIFYYNGKTHQSNYLHQISYGEEELDSYCLVKELKDLLKEISLIRKGI